MVKAVSGLVRRIVGLLAFVFVAWAGWQWGDYVFPPLLERAGVAQEPVLAVDGVEPSPELGQATWDRVLGFMEGGAEDIELSGPEVTSLLRYARADQVPEGLSDPAVFFEEGRAEASADVAVADFPGLPDLGPAAGILPDTVRVQITGSIIGFGEGEAVLFAQGIEIAGVPLPRAVIPEVMRGLGREHRPGLPPEAVAVDLPDGIASVHVSGDRLVVVGGN